MLQKARITSFYGHMEYSSPNLSRVFIDAKYDHTLEGLDCSSGTLPRYAVEIDLNGSTTSRLARPIRRWFFIQKTDDRLPERSARETQKGYPRINNGGIMEIEGSLLLYTRSPVAENQFCSSVEY
jgi:hypothetical protein